MEQKDFGSFGLRPELLATLERKQFNNPTPVQEKVLSIDDHEKDLIVRAKTGSGKTLAFLLPLFNEGRVTMGKPRVLVLSPTRELAQQIGREAEWLGNNMDLRIATLVGGMDISGQIRDLRRGASLIVGTPGRTLDHIRRGTLKLNEVHTVILDEGDHMLDMGFRDELEGILDSIEERERTWLFSATMPAEVRSLSKRYLTDPEYISLVEEGDQHSDIEHKVYMVPRRYRIDGLVNVLLWAHSKRGLIFCHTRAETMEVADRLLKEGFKASCLHGDMSQRERNTALSSFRSGNISLLVATNVAARGLDVPGVEHVFQFGLPDDMETFVHRSGRTGRAGHDGENIVILNPRESRKFRFMLRGTKIKVDWLPVPDGNEIKKKHRERYEEKILNGPVPSNEDVRIWAADLLQREDPVSLVTRLLHIVNKKVPSGYDIQKELKKEMESKDRYDSKERDRDRNRNRKPAGKGKTHHSRERGTTVTLHMKQKNGWNVGRVLRSVCSALEVDRNEVCQINLNEDDIQVNLMPLALEKFQNAAGPLNRWGLVPADNGEIHKSSSHHRQSSKRKPSDRRPRRKETSKAWK